MQQQNLKRPTEEFRKEFLDESKCNFPSKFQSTVTGNNLPQKQYAPGLTYAQAEQNQMQQKSQRNYYTDPQHAYLAAGDGNIQALKAKYPSDGKDVRCKRSQTRQSRTRASGVTYSESSGSSCRSDSTRQTAIEQSKKGKQLIKLTHSKASLIKTVDEGMSKIQQERCCCNKMASTHSHARQPMPKDMYRSSEESNACTTASAGVINEKIIHPMIKKFRLLYLHNIKQEVSIMEDLETLPHKLDEICRKMEKE